IDAFRPCCSRPGGRGERILTAVCPPRLPLACSLLPSESYPPTEEAVTLPQAAAAVAARTESEFLARMSQALRSSLYAILGYSELMAEGEFGPLTEEQGQILARIRQNALALHGLDTEMSNRAGRDMPARLQAERRRQRSWQAIMAVNACAK